MRIGSLFSGIGGLELGLERAGVGNTVWQVEQSEFCRSVLARHWPDAERFVDVKTVGQELRDVEVICGGFPCQDISDAGKRAGIKGERSGLWSHFARIIRTVRPRFVVVENVAALLVRGMGRVVADLAGMGYDCEWHCIPAAAVGSPQLRARIFILAYASCERGKEKRQASLQSGRLVADLRPRWAPEPEVVRVAHGVPGRMDLLRGLGNAVVPQCAEVVGRMIVGMLSAQN